MALVPLGSEARTRNLVFLAGMLAWLLYTRVYFAASAGHVTLPACPFLLLTGHPCPFCGGTRSFAYMWQGDAAHAARLYPLGPGFFYATLLAIQVLAAGRALNRGVSLPRVWWKALLAAAVTVLAFSWMLKLSVLPN